MIGRFEQFNIFGFRCESRVHNLLGEKGESLWLLSIFSLAAILWNINQNPLLTLFSYVFNQHFVFITKNCTQLLSLNYKSVFLKAAGSFSSKLFTFQLYQRRLVSKEVIWALTRIVVF